MEEKTKYLEWTDLPEEGKQKAPHGNRLRHAAITWTALLWTFAAVSCNSWTNDPIRQQERIARHEQELADITYKLHVKVDARKERVDEYNRLLAQCETDPDNTTLKNYTRLLWKEIMEYNKEIESLAKKKLKKTVRLDDDKSKSKDGMMLGRHVTDANYYDFLFY